MDKRWFLMAGLLLAVACDAPPMPPGRDGGTMDAARATDSGSPVAEAGTDACTGTGCCATPDCGCGAGQIPCTVDGAVACVDPMTDTRHCGMCGGYCPRDAVCEDGTCCGTRGRPCCRGDYCFKARSCLAGLCS